MKLTDDGAGFEPGSEHDGFGLIGMKERVDQLNGQFEIHSERGRGSETLVAFPYPPLPQNMVE